ncbi:MAG: hypothetical protein AAGE98_19535 [Actinomycetota bacterium]
MTGTLILDTERADRLVGAYRVSASVIEHDAEVVRNAVADVEHVLVREQPAAAADILARLTALIGMLRDSGDDLAWRVAYVRARAANGLPIGAPVRDPRFERLALADLVDALAGDDRQAALQEIVIRSLGNPDIAGRVARMLGPDGVREFADSIYPEADAVMNEHGHGFVDLPDGMSDEDYRDAVRRALEDATANHALLLAALSHSHQGRTMLRDAWDLDDAPHVNAMAVALLQGEWDQDFLLGLADEVFSDSWLRYGFDSTHTPNWWGGGVVAPELFPPHGAVLAAVTRHPDAARSFVLDRDGYVQLTGPDGWPMHNIFTDDVFDSLMSGLLDAALTDPAHHDQIADALVHGHGGRPSPLLESIGEQPLAGSLTAETWAEILSTHWPVLAGPTQNESAGADDLANAFTALFERSDAALPVLLAGFGPLLEASFAEAYVDGGDSAVLDAMNTAESGITALAQGLNGIDPGSDQNEAARSAFQALLGYGAKSVQTGLGVTGLPGLVFSHIAAEVVGELGAVVLPDTRVDQPNGRSVLEQLFLQGGTLTDSGQSIPPPGQILLANAVITANPDDDAFVDVPWIRDGTIVEPTERADLIAFGAWFYDTFESETYRDDVVERAEAIADGADTWLDVDWSD